jgi:hypothetical protein
MRTIIAVVAIALLMTPLANAAELTEQQALAKAVGILKGDPYGSTSAEVTANVVQRRLGPRRTTVCGGGETAVWAFHVVVPKAKNRDNAIDGWLVIEARSGRLVCASLPFLD